MPSTVGIVSARPETIAEDYRRVLEIAGLRPDGGGPIPRPVTLAEGADPGFGSPPWQRVLAMRAWGKAADAVVGDDVVPGRPGKGEPPGDNSASPLLLLPVPRLADGWGVFNAVALWTACRGRSVTDPRRREGYLADVLKAARPRPWVLCDAVMWGSGGGTLKRDFIQRNVLLAGDDPVAVDAVAMRLAGMTAGEFPWLAALQVAGVGFCDMDLIRLRGDVGLLDEPFVGRRWAGTAAWDASLRGKIAHLAWSFLRRRGMRRRFAGTPWGRLAASWS